MESAGAPGIALGERRSGPFAGQDDCAGGKDAADGLLEQKRYAEALAKLEALSAEFSQEGQVRDLLVQARQAMERAWVIAQAMAHCDQLRRTAQFDMALDVLDSALAACGAEPAILTLRSEVEEQRRKFQSAPAVRPVPDQAQRLFKQKDQDEWRAAQDFFSRRKFREAEGILARLATPDHPDAQALLEKVRAARAASEEEQFYKRGRETALKLIQDQLFEQAADLLCNLLTLFPGDPVLERDLRCAQGRHEDPQDDTVAASQARCEPELFELPAGPPRKRLSVRIVEAESRVAAAPTHARWAVIAAALLFLLVWPPVLDPTQFGVAPASTQASLGPVDPHAIDAGDFQTVRLLSGPSPAIPPLAKLLGIDGNVNLEATVDSEGRVTNVTVLRGNPLLVPAATDAVLKHRFQPATRNGQPLEVKIRIQVTFDAG